MSLLLALLISTQPFACTRDVVRVATQDMEGTEVQYVAVYWLCQQGAKPASVGPVMPICFEHNNPYGRVLWSAPYLKPDVEWVCKAD